MVVHTTLFRSNRSQAVRPPKSVAFDDTVPEVVILSEGVRRAIVPVEARNRGLVDVTGTPRGFRRLDGLRSENWLA